METKSFALGEVKAIADSDQPGTFEAYVSIFGNVDSYDDRMVKGAFKRTLAEKGMPPVVWSHEWQVPPIGHVESATETDEGLLIKGRLFTGPDEDHAVARQVYTAMKAGALKEFSFGYQTKGSRDVEEDGKTIREITDVDLFEVGPTLIGANDQTRLVGVKTLERAVAASMAVESKTGRVLSKANETKLADAYTAIGEVLAQVGEEEPKAGKTGRVEVRITADAKNLTATADETPQQADNPDPNPPEGGEEDRARIGRLLLQRPIHLEEHTA